MVQRWRQKGGSGEVTYSYQQARLSSVQQNAQFIYTNTAYRRHRIRLDDNGKCQDLAALFKNWQVHWTVYSRFPTSPSSFRLAPAPNRTPDRYAAFRTAAIVFLPFITNHARSLKLLLDISCYHPVETQTTDYNIRMRRPSQLFMISTFFQAAIRYTLQLCSF